MPGVAPAPRPRPRIALAALLLACGGLGLSAVGRGDGADRPDVAEFTYHHDHVLGTSLDLTVAAATEADADAAEAAVLAEVERLRGVFSTYDPGSELSRLNRATGPVPASADLLAVLRAYEGWGRDSGGAFGGRVGGLARAWKDAAKAGREPDPAVLSAIAADLRQPGWVIDPAGPTVIRLTAQPLDLNSGAKGYILAAAADAVRDRVPAVRGLLLNIGGDLAVRGTPAGGAGWAVGIQDPFRPADNSPPLTGLRLAGGAVATSGGYQRGFTVGGRSYSHVLDPRTGRPASGVASATVVAADNLTANCLATTLCVLPPDAGLELVAATPGASCLLVTPDGRLIRSAGLPELPVAESRTSAALADPPAAPKGDPWPDGYQVTVGVELPELGGGARRYRRPYVAVWVEGADGKPVRTLGVWGNAPKYLRDLTDWWKIGKGDAALVKAVTRATRGPGKYTLTWDGKDDKGDALPQGKYTVRVEAHREHGRHVRQSGEIACGAEAAKAAMEKNDETGPTAVTYGKGK